MTTYQTMTFGTGGNAGSIEQVSQQDFYESFGDPWGDSGWDSMPEADYGSAWEPSEYYDPTPQQYVEVPARLSGPVGVPSAPAKIFDAKTSDYDIVPGKQHGNLNDPRTVQGADGYFYTVTRIGTDKYDISRVDSPAAITGPTENTIVFSPVKDVQVAVQAKQGSSIPVQLIKSDNQGSETFILSDQMSEDEVSEAYESILQIVSGGGSSYSAPSVPETTKQLFIQSVIGSPKAPSGSASLDKSAVLFPPKSPSTPAAPGGEGDDMEGSGDESASPPPNTYEQFSTTHPGAIDVVESGTGKILRSYYPSTGRDVSETDETFAGVDKTKLNLPGQSLEEQDIEKESLDDAYQDIMPSTEKIEITSAVGPLPFNFNKPTGFADDKPASTGEELGYVYAESLSRYNPGGNNNGDNEAVAAHFNGLIPAIIQGEVDPHKLAAIVHQYEDLKNGATSESNKVYIPGTGYVGLQTQKPFNELELHEQKNAIQDLINDAANEDIPVGYVLSLINELIQGEDNEGTRRDLISYIENGGLEKDLRAFGNGSPIANLMGWATSDEGLVTIGAAFGALSTAGAFVVGGPLVGIGALGMSEYASTELVQMFGSNVFKTKAQQQNAGVYSADHKMRYNEGFKSTEQLFYDFSKYYKDWDEATRANKLAELQEAYRQQGISLRNETVFLSDLGIYPSELKRWENMGSTLSGLSKIVDPITGTLTGATLQPAQIFITPPDGGRVTGTDFVVGAKNSPPINKKDQGSFSVEIWDKNGNLVKTELISYYPGNIITKDYSNLLAFESTKGSSGAESPLTGKTTVYVPAGIQFEYLGKTYTGGEAGKSFDIQRQDGAPLRLTFESIDGSKKPLTEYIGFPEAGWNQYSVPPDLKGGTAETVEGLQTYLAPGQRLYWQDLDITGYIDPETGKVAMPGPGYYMLSLVNPDGTKTSKNVYVGAGTFNTLSLGDVAYKPPAKTGSSGGGGGGGGGGGSSYVAPKSTSKPASPSGALIIYGETCRYARIWQDDIEVAPEIGVSYSISPGYHAVRVEKEGKKPWTKTVYCMASDTITVSPAFEDIDVYNPPTNEEPGGEDQLKRVFVNSNPSGAKVLINGSASGQWTPCFFDLPEGYYLFTIAKSGYDSYDIKCYVGEVIAWGDQASALARSRGWL